MMQVLDLDHWERMVDLVPNVIALRDTMDRVLAADAVGLHDQHVWAQQVDECHTSGCFAGHYAFAQGYTQVNWEGPTTDGLHFDSGVVVTNPDTGHSLYADRTGTGSIGHFAMVGLGLTVLQADVLFHQDNTLKDLKALVDALCDGREMPAPHDYQV